MITMITIAIVTESKYLQAAQAAKATELEATAEAPKKMQEINEWIRWFGWMSWDGSGRMDQWLGLGSIVFFHLSTCFFLGVYWGYYNLLMNLFTNFQPGHPSWFM